MVQQASRHSRGHTQEQAAGDGSALFSFCKGMAFVPRHVVNAQVSQPWLGCHRLESVAQLLKLFEGVLKCDRLCTVRCMCAAIHSVPPCKVPRAFSSMSSATGGYYQGLHAFSDKHRSVMLCRDDTQVVIAGASETGLSCLEHLLLQPHIKFTHLTLLAPGGVNTDGVASQLSAQRISRLGLHANITTVDSHLVALDAQQQLLMLADGTQMPYDLLAVATGLQVRDGPCAPCGSLLQPQSGRSAPAVAVKQQGCGSMLACCCHTLLSAFMKLPARQADAATMTTPVVLYWKLQAMPCKGRCYTCAVVSGDRSHRTSAVCHAQDQLGPAVAGAFPDASQFVLSAQQLVASNITPELAASLHSVLVYGADLHAFDVLTTLIGAGVNAGAAVEACPHLFYLCPDMLQSAPDSIHTTVGQLTRMNASNTGCTVSTMECVNVCLLCADAITWVCPGEEQEAPSLPLLRGLAAQVRQIMGVCKHSIDGRQALTLQSFQMPRMHPTGESCASNGQVIKS
jgi:hypothetical protein